MKKTTKAAIRKALVKKNIQYSDWNEFKALAAQYKCTEQDIYTIHNGLIEERKIGFNGALYEWTESELEHYIGDDPNLHFIALLGWGGCQMIVGGWYFVVGLGCLVLFLIKTILKLTWSLIKVIWHILKSIYGYFTE